MIDDDIDAITPCPISDTITSCPAGSTTVSNKTIDPMPIDEDLRTTRSASPTSSLCSSLASRRRESLKVIEEGTDGDPDRLWQRMLVLQQKFGCYNSARMSAALSSGNFSILRPSKACLDLLNENMTALPETLVDWLRPN